MGTTGIKAGETYHIAFVMDGTTPLPTLQWNGHRIPEWSGLWEVPGVHLLYNHGDDYAIGGVWTNAAFWDEDPASNLSAVGDGFFFDGWIDEWLSLQLFQDPSRPLRCGDDRSAFHSRHLAVAVVDRSTPLPSPMGRW